jgi:hypothetical protein
VSKQSHASRAAYRSGLQFADETPLPGESFERTAIRLLNSRHARWQRVSGALIIGSDQVASCAGERMDSPGRTKARCGNCAT